MMETFTCHATDALERSFKRQRTEKSTKSASVTHSTFTFPDLYNDLVATSDEETFPSIDWNFDDESDSDDNTTTAITFDQLHPNTRLLLNCTKQSTNPLQRSKSFRTNLSDINQCPIANEESIVESRIHPLQIADEKSKEIRNNLLPDAKLFDSTVMGVSLSAQTQYSKIGGKQSFCVHFQQHVEGNSL
jgi:hypothetical protein